MKLAVAVLVLLTAASAFAGDVTGRWNASVPSPDGQAMELVFTFKVDGTTLTGTVQSPMGDVPISEGKVEGEAISFSVDTGSFVILHKGTVSGDTMKLTSEMGDQKFEITATRAPAPAPAPPAK
jgi:hypothetical protein